MFTNRDAKWQKVSDILEKQNSSFSFQPSRKIYLSRLCSENIFVLLLQYIGLFFSNAFSHHPLILFASGTAVALIFLRGVSVLPGIWLGSFFYYSLANTGLKMAFNFATFFSLQSFLLLWFSYRYIFPTLIFSNRIQFVKFILFTIFLIIFLMLFFVPQKDFLSTICADLNGILIVGFSLVTFDAYFPQLKNFKIFSKETFTYSGVFFLAFIIGLTSNLYFFLGSILVLCLILFFLGRDGWPHEILAIFLCGSGMTFATYFEVINKNIVFLQSLLLSITIIGLFFSLTED